MDNIEQQVDELLARGLGSSSDRTNSVDLIRWLLGKPQDYWLFTAAYYVWDWGAVPLCWMIEQPECDIAVAATVYWLGEPEILSSPGYADADGEVARWDDFSKLLARIVERARQHEYCTSHLGVLLDDYPSTAHLADLVEQIGSKNSPYLPIPKDLIDGFGTERPRFGAFQVPEDKGDESNYYFHELVVGGKSLVLEGSSDLSEFEKYWSLWAERHARGEKVA